MITLVLFELLKISIAISEGAATLHMEIPKVYGRKNDIEFFCDSLEKMNDVEMITLYHEQYYIAHHPLTMIDLHLDLSSLKVTHEGENSADVITVTATGVQKNETHVYVRYQIGYSRRIDIFKDVIFLFPVEMAMSFSFCVFDTKSMKVISTRFLENGIVR